MLRIPNEHWKRICDILADAFLRPDLEMLVRFNLPHRLDLLVDVAQPLDVVVFKLWEKCDQRGETEALLRGAVKARPGREDLIAFCKEQAPQVFAAADVAALVGQVEGGLYALVEARRDPGLGIEWGKFQTTFRDMQEGISLLARYKKLHDGLHNLQKRMGQIGPAATAFAQKPVSSPLLSREAVALKRDCDRAKKTVEQRPPLPTDRLERLWVDDLTRAAREFESALLAPFDGGLLARAMKALGGLLLEAYRIDGQMASEAARLPLSGLIGALTAIHEQLAAAGRPASPAAVLLGRDALSLVRPQVVGRVNEHNEWQWLNKELAGIESNQGHRPTDKVLRWEAVRETLLGLCHTFGSEPWATDLLAGVERWEREAAAGNVAAAEAAAGTVHECAKERFFDVDQELLGLCDRLDYISAPLRALT